MADPFTSSQAYTIASENQPARTYPNLQGLNTIAPTIAVAHVSTSENLSGETSLGYQAGASSSLSSYPSVIPTSVDGCGVTKGCLATPSNCLSSGGCQAVITYQKDSKRPGEFRFELWRTTTLPNDQYVAMGLNHISPSMVCCVLVTRHKNAILRTCRSRWFAKCTYSNSILFSFSLGQESSLA